MAEEMAPVHPSVRHLLGWVDEKILKLAECVYHRQYQVASSILPHQCQDQLMGGLHRELGQWMMRAGLCITTASDQFLSRAECAAKLAPSLKLGHPWWRPAWRKASLPPRSMDATVYKPISPHPQTLQGTRSTPMLPPVMKGVMKPSMPNGWEGIQQWGAPNPDVGTPMAGVDPSSIGSHHQEIGYRGRYVPRLPGMSLLYWALHAHRMKMSGYTVLSANWTYSHSSKNPKKGN